MTVETYYWDGTTLGDATVAPYTAAEFFRPFSKLLISDKNDGYVIPGYTNELEVTESAVPAASVDINTGFAFAKGVFAENDASATVAVTANASGNPRKDYVVLRITWATQDAEFVVIAGTPAASPALPALTQNYGTTWDIPLAWIWVADGFATITDSEIHNARVFSTGAYSRFVESGENLVRNGEWLGVPETGADLIPYWWENGSASPTLAAPPTQQTRGHAIKLTAAAGGEGLIQGINVKPDTTYTIKFLYKATTDYGEVLVRSGVGYLGTATTLAQITLRNDSWTEETVVVTTAASHYYLSVFLRTMTATPSVIEYGQVMVVEGYHPGPFRAKHETILFKDALDDATWLNNTLSTGSTDIDFDADFQVDGRNGIAAGIVAVYLAVSAYDSGSAAGTPSVGVARSTATGKIGVDAVTVYLAGVPDDEPRQSEGWIAMLSDVTNIRTVTVDHNASGAGTLDVTVAVRGIQT